MIDLQARLDDIGQRYLHQQINSTTVAMVRSELTSLCFEIYSQGEMLADLLGAPIVDVEDVAIHVEIDGYILNAWFDRAEVPFRDRRTLRIIDDVLGEPQS